jgi:CheY-like chemotaxis protein
MTTRPRSHVTGCARRSIIEARSPKSSRKRGTPALIAPRSSRLPCRVLVVDDDPDARLLVGAMVEAYCDASVTLVASVDEAIASVGRVLPDLVVTDALMPGQDGFDLLRRIRQVPRAGRVPVIVATASPEPELHERLRAAGATAILAKPPTPEVLAQTVGAALASCGD